MNDYDVVVVGGGAAGLSGALVLSRARRSVAVVDAGAPRNAPAPHMHGFLSRDGLPPSMLLAMGRDEVKSYGGDFVAASVEEAKRHDESQFHLRLDSGAWLTARRLLVTTGLRDVVPNLPGVQERWGRDLLHCPYCHGYEVRDQPLGVLGGTPGATDHAQLVRQWSSDVVFFPHTDAVTPEQRHQLGARGIQIAEGHVRRLVAADDHLRGVELEGGQVVHRSAIFVRPTFAANSTLLTDLSCDVDDNGWVRTDASGRTSIDGVWVAGNVVNPRAQVITAAGEGSTAAIAINADLVAEEVMLALTAPRSGLST